MLTWSLAFYKRFEVEMAGDYEGYVTWYVSAETARPFNVFTLTGPPRLVVDICH